MTEKIMKQMTCEMCGSTDLAKENGFVVCQSCGMKYSVEEAKKLIIEGSVEVHGSVSIDKTNDIINWLKRAAMFLAEGNFVETHNFCDKVLDADTENAYAYFYKLMADLKTRTKEEFAICGSPSFVEKNINYQKALLFGDSTLKSTLRDYLNAVETYWKRFEATFEYEQLPNENRYKILKLKDKNAHFITIPNFVYSIEDQAFLWADIFSITIGTGVYRIAKDAFEGCIKLLEIINLSTRNIAKDGDYADIGRYALNISTDPNTISKLRTTEDGFVFYEDEKVCYLIACIKPCASISLPSSYNGRSYEIYDCAFIYCDEIINVTIPSDVTSIREGAFQCCENLKTITISEGVIDIYSQAFSGCINLKNITIPNSVTSIGYQAFYGCTNLENITIPNSVTDIGHQLFCGCSNLKSVNLPDSKTEIAYEDFKECTSLTNIVIPDSVTEIDESAFYGCSSLTSIVIPHRVTRLGEAAFRGCTKLTSVIIHEGVTKIEPYAFAECTSLKEIAIPDSVTTIGIGVFQGCANLTNVTFNNPHTRVGNLNFDGSDTHKLSITFKISEQKYKTVSLAKYIDKYNLQHLKSITIPDGVTSIDDHAYSDCKHLTSVTIPNSVTSIGDSAFCNCKRLTSVTIPNSVTSIGKDAFSFCDRLNRITFKGTVAEWDAIKKGSLHYMGFLPHVICSDGTVTLKKTY